MRQYLVNELNSDDIKKIENFLDKNTQAAGIAGMYWLPLPDELLAASQQGHEQCGPFSFGIELGEDFVSFELLVRSKSNLHCSCTAYADNDQRKFLMNFADQMMSQEEIAA